MILNLLSKRLLPKILYVFALSPPEPRLQGTVSCEAQAQAQHSSLRKTPTLTQQTLQILEKEL
jgi:hypothetical protein